MVRPHRSLSALAAILLLASTGAAFSQTGGSSGGSAGGSSGGASGGSAGSGAGSAGSTSSSPGLWVHRALGSPGTHPVCPLRRAEEGTDGRPAIAQSERRSIAFRCRHPVKQSERRAATDRGRSRRRVRAATRREQAGSPSIAGTGTTGTAAISGGGVTARQDNQVENRMGTGSPQTPTSNPRTPASAGATTTGSSSAGAQSGGPVDTGTPRIANDPALGTGPTVQTNPGSSGISSVTARPARQAPQARAHRSARARAPRRAADRSQRAVESLAQQFPHRAIQSV